MKLKSMALAAALTAIGSPAGAQGVVMVRDVSYDMALVMAQTAIEHCRSLGFKIGVSVVDRGGHVLATLRDHGAAHHTVELAQRKAYTSRSIPPELQGFLAAAARQSDFGGAWHHERSRGHGRRPSDQGRR